MITFWKKNYRVVIYRYHSGGRWQAYGTTLYRTTYDRADLVARELLRALDRYEDSTLSFEVNIIDT